MNKKTIFLDSFSGSLMDLPKNKRTKLNAIEALRRDGMISTWDMTEIWKGKKFVFELIQQLKDERIIKELPQGYPWHRYEIM